ncbi:MAG: hypothetical protein PHV34_06795, partial [Verrucomicrobiae bacterium]|nr:hypothetical protein [Verrucomicrobiae bacterium]
MNDAFVFLDQIWNMNGRITLLLANYLNGWLFFYGKRGVRKKNGINLFLRENLAFGHFYEMLNIKTVGEVPQTDKMWVLPLNLWVGPPPNPCSRPKPGKRVENGSVPWGLVRLVVPYQIAIDSDYQIVIIHFWSLCHTDTVNPPSPRLWRDRLEGV